MGHGLKMPGMAGLGEYAARVRSTTLAGDDDCLTLTYHRTAVAVIRPGAVTLNSGGYRTVTTKDRMNAALRAAGMPQRVYQEAGRWFILNTDNRESIPYEDGITVGAGVPAKV